MDNDGVVLGLLAFVAAGGAVAHAPLAAELLLGLNGELLDGVPDVLGHDGVPAGVRLALFLNAHAACQRVDDVALVRGQVTGTGRGGVEAAVAEDGLALGARQEGGELVEDADGVEADVVAAQVLSGAAAGGDGGVTPLDGHLEQLQHLLAEYNVLAQLVALRRQRVENAAFLGRERLVTLDGGPKVIGHAFLRRNEHEDASISGGETVGSLVGNVPKGG